MSEERAREGGQYTEDPVTGVVSRVQPGGDVPADAVKKPARVKSTLPGEAENGQ